MLKIIKEAEENRQKWLKSENDLRKAMIENVQLHEINHDLERKLHSLRKSYGKELMKTKALKRKADCAEAIVGLIRETVDPKSSKTSLCSTSSQGSYEYMMSVIEDPTDYLKTKFPEKELHDYTLGNETKLDKTYDDELEFDKSEDDLDGTITEPRKSLPRKALKPQELELSIKTSATNSPTGTMQSYTVSNNSTILMSNSPISYSSMSRPRKSVRFDSSRIGDRPHKLVEKKIYKSKNCCVCAKRISFCSNASACEVCKSLCHTSCATGLPLPCLESYTPKSGQLKLIGNYAPANVRPSIPTILIHCCKEIEKHHENVQGKLYLVNNSDNEIVALRTKMLDGKNGQPVLGSYDVHTIAGVVKSFLRMLHEPIVSLILRADFFKITGKFIF